MLAIPGGDIVLRDEGAKRNWEVEVRPFLLAPHPVTRELYSVVQGAAPASSAGSRTPVTEVCWIEAVRFCNLLSQETGLSPCYSIGDDPDGQDVVCDWEADGYRLPTEAEWEYACRAGSSGDRYGELDEIAWYRGNSDGMVHDVAAKVPNAWGLHDMIGNVWEWCWDVYDPRVYGPYRVFRGGGWQDHPRGCRASSRRKSHPTLRIDDLGFRLARTR
ncbi:formylglycine-generating enzyme required for sulfatase activity [Lipingzhangella halophila]|uniref:Formylglycine-generating enzyme required for sulfatase activity n=1 Tax=Lipingzhangella halophila TaxID=1783352 RepID=A0A7W7RP05_9ACTN|nr:SUMF1/EgtB/PvdO family nonheme iron enzyme [Lipingzhangella halophila]MBB4935509.1 formylglycine-generating enzyme required for sulfatase activity [Lipingzhangella halophila]